MRHRRRRVSQMGDHWRAAALDGKSGKSDLRQDENQHKQGELGDQQYPTGPAAPGRFHPHMPQATKKTSLSSTGLMLPRVVFADIFSGGGPSSLARNSPSVGCSAQRLWVPFLLTLLRLHTARGAGQVQVLPILPKANLFASALLSLCMGAVDGFRFCGALVDRRIL